MKRDSINMPVTNICFQEAQRPPDQGFSKCPIKYDGLPLKTAVAFKLALVV